MPVQDKRTSYFTTISQNDDEWDRYRLSVLSRLTRHHCQIKLAVKRIVISSEWKSANVRYSVVARIVQIWKPTSAYIAELLVEFDGLKLKGQVELGGGDSSTSGGAFYKAKTPALAVDGAIRHSTQWRGPRALTSGGREEER